MKSKGAHLSFMHRPAPGRCLPGVSCDTGTGPSADGVRRFIRPALKRAGSRKMPGEPYARLMQIAARRRRRTLFLARGRSGGPLLPSACRLASCWVRATPAFPPPQGGFGRTEPMRPTWTRLPSAKAPASPGLATAVLPAGAFRRAAAARFSSSRGDRANPVPAALRRRRSVFPAPNQPFWGPASGCLPSAPPPLSGRRDGGTARASEKRVLRSRTGAPRGGLR